MSGHGDVDPNIAALLEAGEEADARRVPGAWLATWRWVAGAAAVALLAWLTYSRDGWIPLLSAVDLGTHEFGHMIFMWAPSLFVSFAGSLVQVATPAGLAAYFAWRRDGLAVVLMLGWTAESLNNVSVYIYDASRLMLPLWGDDGTGAGHDWANILVRLGLLPHTDAIAFTVRGLSAAVFALALGICAWNLARPALERRRERLLAQRRETLPVREPRNPVARPEPSAVEPGDREL